VRESVIDLPVQVNGKVRGHIAQAADAGRDDIEKAALGDPGVQKHLEGLSIQKIVIVPGKLISIVASKN